VARKVKVTKVVNGIDTEVEEEVPDGPPAAWGDPKAMRILGKRNPRQEGPEKVTGRAKYASDIVLPGMCYGRFLGATPAAGKVAAIDLSAAERLPGVKAVLGMAMPGAVIRYAGQPLAAVAAITPEIAEDALRAIKVTYEAAKFVVDHHKAADATAPKVRPGTPSNVVSPGGKTEGNVEDAFAKAAAVVEGTYEAQTRLHCCLETHGHTVKWDGDQLTVWASTQFIQGVRDQFGSLAGGPKNVRVICEHMGGGFGSKFGMGDEGRMAALLAKKANAPVRFMLARQDEQMWNFRGPGAVADIKIGAAADGTLVATHIRAWNEGGEQAASTSLNDGPYIVAPLAWKAEFSSVLTNTAGTAALRAPGRPQAEVIWGAALDDLAAKLNMDPLELRKKNHNDPVRVAEWDLGAKIIGWDRRQKVPGSAPGVKKRGIGMGSATWGGGGGGGAQVDVVVGRDGSVKAINGCQDLGTGARTYVAGIVAEELGLELHQVQGVIGDSLMGFGHASGGSTTTGSIAPAVKMAAVNAKDQLLIAAAQALKVKPEEVELGLGGKAQVKGQPGKSLTWKQLCATLPASGLKVRGEWNADLQTSGARGCDFAEVEVDTETGKVTVLKVVGVQDCGFLLNRLQAESQVMGAIIQGIGTALLEERHMDSVTGRMLNPNFEEYKLCGSFEAGGINIPMDPPYRTLGAEERGIVSLIFDTPTGKVIGIGEPAIIGVQAAIANAIFNAIGVRVYQMPATPDRVLAALARKKGAQA